jgi:hypothetical protein
LLLLSLLLLLLLLPQLPLYRRSVMITPSSARRTGSYRDCAGKPLTGDCWIDDAWGTGKRARVVVTTAAVVVTVVVAGGVLRWLLVIELRRRLR